jgi:microsomal dipeptidase-like Zn-dependent dipeptidase
VVPESNPIGRLVAIEGLLKRDGFRAAEIAKVMGQNWQRVLTAVLG